MRRSEPSGIDETEERGRTGTTFPTPRLTGSSLSVDVLDRGVTSQRCLA
jgi:hypothetical protein